MSSKLVQDALEKSDFLFQSKRIGKDQTIFSIDEKSEGDLVSFTIEIIPQPQRVEFKCASADNIRNLKLAQQFALCFNAVPGQIAKVKAEENQKLVLESVYELPYESGLMFWWNSSSIQEAILERIRLMMDLFRNFPEDLTKVSRRSKEDMDQLAKEFLVSEKIKFSEEEDGFHAIWKDQNKKYLTVISYSEEEKFCMIKLVNLDEKVRDLEGAQKWLENENNAFKRKGDGFSIDEENMMVLNIACRFDENDEDEKIKEQLDKCYRTARLIFEANFKEFVEFCKLDEIVMNGIKKYLSEAKNIEVNVRPNGDLTFDIPALECAARVKFVPPTSTVFFMLQFGDNVPETKGRYAMKKMIELNERETSGFLDMDIKDGELRYMCSISHCDVLPLDKIVQEQFAMIFRKATQRFPFLAKAVEHLFEGEGDESFEPGTDSDKTIIPQAA
jgi:hypothetical protein